MIRSFKCEETRAIFEGNVARRLIPQEVQAVARRKLRMLHQARHTADLLSPPSNRFEALKGNLKGKYSIRINQRWRVVFEWAENNAYNVYIDDYH